jgi:ribosomal protein S18 acetylase RimI-like enzyme
VQFQFIDHSDRRIEEVISLGKSFASTLGLMPRDAYLDQAKKKCLLVAIDNNAVVGFCLFRLTLSKMRIGIIQVCVAQTHRRKGIAQSLLSVIRDKYKDLFSGMLISCREDYTAACNLWTRYGFSRMKRVRSRSVEEHYLIKFWYNFGAQNLFTQASTSDLKVVIDVNIIIKLRDDKPEDVEVKQLLSDWLTDEVDYYYTKESLTEIHRDKDHARTNKTLTFLSSFQELNCDISQCDQYL